MTPCGRRRRPAAPRGRSAPPGRRPTRSPAPPRRPSPPRPGRDDGAEVRQLAEPPMGEPGERAHRLVVALKHLPPLPGRRIGHRGARHAGAGARLGERRDRLDRDRPRLERAERRVALHVPLDDAGLEQLPAGKVVPRMTRSTCGASSSRGRRRSSRSRRPVGERMRRRCDGRIGMHRLRRDDAESQARIAPESLAACG